MTDFLFICGAPRSGTTLLLSLLDGHKDLRICPHETHILQYWNYHKHHKTIDKFFTRDYLNTHDISLLTDEASIDMHNQYIQSVYDTKATFHKIMNGEAFIESYHKQLTNQDITLDSIYQTVFNSLFGENTGIYVEKRPLDNEIEAVTLNKALPNAKFIHIIRDPRTRYLSAKMRRKLQIGNKKLPIITKNHNDTNFAVAHASISMCSIKLASMNKQVLKDKYLVLKYEDLQLDPEYHIKNICVFLGIEYHPDMLKQTYFGKPQTGISSFTEKENHSNVVQVNTKNRTEKYYQHTTKFERKIVNCMTWQVAQEYNYDVKKVERIRGWDVLFSGLLKYENPFSYIKNRKEMLRNLVTSSSNISKFYYHDLIDKFSRGIPVGD